MATLLNGVKLLKRNGDNFSEVDAKDALNGKVVALYFSAHWCPPCKMFTPVLKDLHEELAGEPFEVVFVSFDRSEDDLKHYMKELHGEWCALKFGDDKIQELSDKYGVQGIPALIIIKPDGTVITADGRGQVQKKDKAPAALLKEWKTASGL